MYLNPGKFSILNVVFLGQENIKITSKLTLNNFCQAVAKLLKTYDLMEQKSTFAFVTRYNDLSNRLVIFF